MTEDITSTVQQEGPPSKKQCLSSPEELQQELEKKNAQIESLKKKLKSSQQKSRRLSGKVTSLKNIVKSLKQHHLISTNCEEMLNQTFSGVPLSLMKRMTAKKSGKGRRYSPVLKSFALTLQFYSAKAYEFVRKTFDIALPSQSQIRRWYGKVAADPGFTKPAFNALKVKVEDAHKMGKEVICSLMLDEMAIKKHISWDGKKYHGYVDLGNGVVDDTLPAAKDALVFMVVSLNESWKVPCGYFFIDGLSGKERANLVKVCIQRLHDVGVKVTSLTCDGPSCHISMLTALGATLDPSNMVPYFLHPQDKNEKIYVLLDICHMLKLVRNTLGEGGILYDRDGGKIQWQYLVELEEFQHQEGLRLGNKLRMAHIKWKQQKMKVNLAAQAFSSSVADAIEYCTQELKMPQFQGSEATVKFIRTFDHLFDILNSRNPLAKGFKSPLRINNKSSWDPFLDEAYNYIMGLKNPAGEIMHTTRRKTGFFGFLVAIKSTKGIFHKLVEADKAPLKYLLTYKLSQDHLELFFGAVRSAGGFNNNPTTQQFTAAYKRLLLRSHIEGGKGNCEKRDPIRILSAITDTCKVSTETGTTVSTVTITNAAIIRKYDLEERRPVESDHDYCDSPNICKLSDFKKASISYIAGYVARKVEMQTLCSDCSSALGSTTSKPTTKFLKLKDRGNLYKPTQSVIDICEETEKCFKRLLVATSGNLPHGKGIVDAVAVSVLGACNNSSLFKELEYHMFDTTVEENHIHTLIKSIIKCYCKVRLYHLGREATENLCGDKIRTKLHKLVLFNHQ